MDLNTGIFEWPEVVNKYTHEICMFDAYLDYLVNVKPQSHDDKTI